MKNSNDYDSVFKTMKLKTKRLFIPVINNIFGRDYDFNEEVTVLSSECADVRESADGTSLESHLKESDYRIRIEQSTYLLECMSYDDIIQIRITEYAFQSAIDEADYGPGWAHVKMPHIAVIYVKCGNNQPDITEIRFDFPDNPPVIYKAHNIFLQKLTKEYIVENRLYPYIPFYIARYEKDLSKNILSDEAIKDLEFFRDHIQQDLENKKINRSETIALVGFSNQIIKHITDGNDIEERLVTIMGGGVVLETLYEKLLREGRELGVEQGIEQGTIETLSTLVNDGILTLSEAAQRAGMTITDFKKKTEQLHPNM